MPFHFQRFSIEDDQCAMKVGTDGVLLGAWADVNAVDSILDIGTGSGLIALMLAQRTESNNAQIAAVEICPRAASQARVNISRSPWNDRISVDACSLQWFCEKHQGHRNWEAIVCNPPFFSSDQPSTAPRAIARHQGQLDFATLINSVSRLVAANGSFSIIVPKTSLSPFCELAQASGLVPTRKTTVYPMPGRTAKRILLEFRPVAIANEKAMVTNKIVPAENTLTLESSRHQYSDEFRRIANDFYVRWAEDEE